MFGVITGKVKLSTNQALLYIALAAFLWSTSGLFIKIIDLNPLAIAGLRSAIAAAVMYSLMRSRIDFHLSRPQIIGAIAYALTMLLFVSSTKMTTAANAILLQYTAPVYAALFGAWLLKERATKFDWIIIGIVLGGMLLFFMDRLTIFGLWGNIMAIGSGATMALFIMCMRMQKSGSTFETIVLGNILTAVICLPFCFQQAPTLPEWGALFYMGTLQLGISFLIFSTAIKYVPALDAILVQTLDPILNPVWVYLVIGEEPGRWALLGGFIVVSAVTFRNIHASNVKKAGAIRQLK